MESVRDFTEERVREALLKMALEAENLGVKRGVAAIAFESANSNNQTYFTLTVETAYRDPDPEKDNHRGDNYLAIVLAKIAYMFRTKEPSGQYTALKGVMTGEVPYQGGIIFRADNGFICFAYSGGKQIQDVQIAQVGALYLGFPFS